METVVKELRELGGHHRAFSESKSLLWESMSDYTHGGARQIARWLRTDTIEPQFTDEEKIDCLWLGDLHGLYASMMLCELFDGPLALYVEMVQKLVESARERQALRRQVRRE